MTITHEEASVRSDGIVPPVGAARRPSPRDLQRTFQLVLATVWLLDAALQLQPFMFTRGSERLQRHAERVGRRVTRVGSPTPSPGTPRSSTTSRS